MKLFVKLKSFFTKPNKYKFDIKSADKISKFTLISPYKLSSADVKYLTHVLKDLDSMYNSVIDSKTIDRFKNIVNHKISDKSRDAVKESFENDTPLNVEKLLGIKSVTSNSLLEISQEEIVMAFPDKARFTFNEQGQKTVSIDDSKCSQEDFITIRDIISKAIKK